MADKRSYGRSRSGVELTDEVLEQMAQEAEAGLDVSRLRRRPGRPTMGSGPAQALPVRLDPELRQALDDRAVKEHTTASDVVRQALRRYLRAG
ncbi:MAG: CopG family transcriptional regulator [Acidimicrobiales bacterium]